MAVKFFSKQSPQTKPVQFYKVGTIVVVINVIGGSKTIGSCTDYSQLSDYTVLFTTLQIN